MQLQSTTSHTWHLWDILFSAFSVFVNIDLHFTHMPILHYLWWCDVFEYKYFISFIVTEISWILKVTVESAWVLNKMIFSPKTLWGNFLSDVSLGLSSQLTHIICLSKHNSWLHCWCIGSNPLGLISDDRIHYYIYFPCTRACNWGSLTQGNLSLKKSIIKPC